MCGRYSYLLPPEAMMQLFKLLNEIVYPPRYNIAPTQPIVTVMEREGRRTAEFFRWGFVPAWVKDPRDWPLLINARAETMEDKPAFRDALRNSRWGDLAISRRPSNLIDPVGRAVRALTALIKNPLTYPYEVKLADIRIPLTAPILGLNEALHTLFSSPTRTAKKVADVLKIPKTKDLRQIAPRQTQARILHISA